MQYMHVHTELNSLKPFLNYLNFKKNFSKKFQTKTRKVLKCILRNKSFDDPINKYLLKNQLNFNTEIVLRMLFLQSHPLSQPCR